MKKRDYKVKKAQATIFIILAIILVAGISTFTFLKIKNKEIPSNISPVYDYYVSCIKETALEGANILGSKGGRIEEEEFLSGSIYSPFSSQLDFNGQAIDYWYYLSSNGAPKEKVPSKSDMENELENYLVKVIPERCDMAGFEGEGYSVTFSVKDASVNINEDNVKLKIIQSLNVVFKENSYSISDISTEIKTPLGRFYNIALNLFDYENSRAFIENYSLDVLNNYALVTGVIVNCSPVVWNAENVLKNVQRALENNLAFVKFNGAYFDNAKGDYFITGKSEKFGFKGKEQARILYSGEWAHRLEVWPSDNNLLVVKPIGTQQELAGLGFCYAPYKFTYDLFFPVLFQIYSSDGGFIFQFPYAVVISKNKPISSILNISSKLKETESICDKKNTEIEVFVYDEEYNPISADLSFQCIAEDCSLNNVDSEQNGSYRVFVPTCYNGIISASAKGYKTARKTISTNEETEAELFLRKESELDLEIFIDGRKAENNAVLSLFEKKENSTEYAGNVIYPSSKKIKLSTGYFEFDLRVYGDISIKVPSFKTRQCAEVQAGIIGGIFGITEEKCAEVEVPSQEITNFVYAGGKGEEVIFSDDLKNKKILRIYATSIKKPENADEVALGWDKIENKRITLEIV
jgi:hypothetical protein